jgi:Toxin PAAR-like domain
MGDVYANGMEVSAKKDDNKSLCAMADVCLSPPSPPAGPVPIPYPNTAMASDTSDGSKTVKITGAEVGLKNKSMYKKSTGDEAATKTLGMGVVSHNITGPMRHVAWSMDVKIEGENVIRHMDLTTHNHTNPPQPAAVLNQAKTKIAAGEPLNCDELDALNQEARKDVRKGKTQFTMTTASYTPPPAVGGPSLHAKATAPGRTTVIQSNKQSGYVQSNPKQTMACTNEMYGGARGASNAVENEMCRNHAEPKLMEPVFYLGPGAGTMLMKTHHQTSKTQADAMPCETCRPAICAAVQCGLDIKLCNNDNEEVDPPCQNGQPAPEAEWEARGLGAFPVT